MATFAIHLDINIYCVGLCRGFDGESFVLQREGNIADLSEILKCHNKDKWEIGGNTGETLIFSACVELFTYARFFYIFLESIGIGGTTGKSQTLRAETLSCPGGLISCPGGLRVCCLFFWTAGHFRAWKYRGIPGYSLDLPCMETHNTR